MLAASHCDPSSSAAPPWLWLHLRVHCASALLLPVLPPAPPLLAPSPALLLPVSPPAPPLLAPSPALLLPVSPPAPPLLAPSPALLLPVLPPASEFQPAELLTGALSLWVQMGTR